MRELDGIRILGRGDGHVTERPGSKLRELISTADTGDRWAFGEVVATPDDAIATHIHPGEPEAIIVLEGTLELHGASGISEVGPGDVLFMSLTRGRCSFCGTGITSSR